MTLATRISRVVFAAVVLAVGIVVGPVAIAPAAHAAGFDPGMIISDANFYNSTAMTTLEIQAFLESKGSACVSAGQSTPCLKDYREDTSSRAATARCGVYTGRSNQSSAQILYDVARVCGVNPQVLIVTLQKEQSLITRSTTTARSIQIAMGYGCPDTAPCESQYYGFFNQLYNAASQFQRYRQNPTNYGHVAGRTNIVKFHPNASCGSSSVYIQNQATAGLYNYTPYQPNAAALAGSTNSCSSTGNLNFYAFYTSWFATENRLPVGVVDFVTASSGAITLGGWALDPDTSDSIRVHVYIDGRGAANVEANQSRPDIARKFGLGEAHGFSTTLVAEPGSREVCVYAIDTVSSNTKLTCQDISVPGSRPPIGSLDAVVGGLDSITVGGWALDPDTSDSISVHVYVDGVATAARVASTDRPDVARIYGLGATHGFDATINASPGSHNVCVYAIDSISGNTFLGCRNVRVLANRPPIGSLDAVVGGLDSITVGGWALDLDTRSSIDVQVSVDGSLVQTARANGPRPDVDRVHGLGVDHGFNVTIAASGGRHTVCVTAVDSTSATQQIGCQVVSVTSNQHLPIGVVDSVTASAGTITVGGWALDRDTSDSISVHVYVEGVATAARVASTDRPDIARIYGLGAAHGFDTTINASPGSRNVCVYAIDSTAGNTFLGCQTVNVT